MRFFILVPALLAGCSSGPPVQEGETVPYKAVVAFEWTKGGAGQELPEGLSRLWIEDEILYSLDEHKVFSDVVYAEPEAMLKTAAREKGEILVLIRIGDLGRLKGKPARVLAGPAVFDGIFWMCTYVGGWWMPDLEFPTQSDVEVAWQWMEGAAPSQPPAQLTAAATATAGEFPHKERLASGAHSLSFWDRAKPWSYPLPYLINLLVPPTFVPLQDEDEVNRRLMLAALEDIKRELVGKLKDGRLQSRGAP